MRILYITSGLPFSNGETFIYPELDALEQLGHSVHVCPRDRGRGSSAHGRSTHWSERAWRAGLLSLEVIVAAVRVGATRPKAVARALGLILQDPRPRVLVKNLAVLPKALWLGARVHSERIDFIHGHWCATTGTMAAVASLVSEVPYGITSHRWDLVEGNLLDEKVRTARFFRLISKSGRALVSAHGVDPVRTTLLHMGVELCSSSASVPISRSRIEIVCAANFLPVKGLDILLEAAERMKRAGLHFGVTIFGDGPLQGQLAAMRDRLGIDDVVSFPGRIDHSDLCARMKGGEFDIAVLPSRDLGEGLHEGIPVFLIEAMAAGLPVVSTHTGGIPELVVPGSGLLVADGDSAELANAIGDLIGSPTRRAGMGQCGRELVGHKFSAASVCRELASLMAAGASSGCS
ncbi:glycosyltransferase family 4 protein [Lysobacter sp. GCM10012299]|uniref:glycosyltransferase family 4 protein n=1 Tax=Lysobacter sp. GCM10012299 TaxID=3317333 RepID=UPI00360718F5